MSYLSLDELLITHAMEARAEGAGFLAEVRQAADAIRARVEDGERELAGALEIALKIIHSAAPKAFENGTKDPMGVMDAGETAVAQFVIYAQALLERARAGR